LHVEGEFLKIALLNRDFKMVFLGISLVECVRSTIRPFNWPYFRKWIHSVVRYSLLSRASSSCEPRISQFNRTDLFYNVRLFCLRLLLGRNNDYTDLPRRTFAATSLVWC